ncbi:MAG: lysophospholipid acyltransferase family protein [Ilumatobacter sp.]|uniref:lysophospholipid acyltransferase family protein n=1 Tax=Ilumatobacter sp. TaxID=1967498 RepID=UPI00391B99E1
MGRAPDFDFEPAPALPGADRLSKYGFGAVRNLAHRLWEFSVEGREHVPTDGPAIITPNHLSFCDSIFVPAALPRRVWAIGKGEYMDDWKTKHLFPAMGMIPVDRSGGDAAQAALDTAAKVLELGHLFMIYPEGTRSRSGNLHKGRTGAARLAIRCNAPIIPVGHEGTLEIQPPDSVAMKIRRPITVRFGEPMWAHEYGDADDPRTLRRFTDAVMFEIAHLSGQQYVDVYAGKELDTSAPATEVHAEPEGEQQRVSPRRPSVVGGDPSKVPTPPSRPGSANGNGSGAPASVSAIPRPAGRLDPAASTST